VNHDSYSDAYIKGILSNFARFAIVGASPNPIRPSYFVVKYLVDKGFEVFPVNPGHAGKTIAGRPVFGALAEVPGPVDVVDIFRGTEAALAVTKEAIAIGAKVVWMQLGVRNDEAAQIAEDAGLKVVMNRCPKIEYGRLSGEIGWMGVHRQVIDNRRPLLYRKGGSLKRGS
jgi:uncharacterized protein